MSAALDLTHTLANGRIEAILPMRLAIVARGLIIATLDLYNEDDPLSDAAFAITLQLTENRGFKEGKRQSGNELTLRWRQNVQAAAARFVEPIVLLKTLTRNYQFRRLM